jgi:4Fe-4S binding domain
MFTETQFHRIRWGLALGWLLLISSLFFDPISAVWTDPDRGLSFLRDPSLGTCVPMQGACLKSEVYPIGTRVFWGMVVPSAVFIVLALGHGVWRRICPLYFMSQIPRALGLQPLLDIHQNQWLQRHHNFVQFGLLFGGLNARILLFNSNRMALGIFLVLTIVAAMTVVALYGGRSWCHYVCPFGAVQTVFTGPRGLLDRPAHTAPAGSLTQSMCRTEIAGAPAQIACVGCKSACFDIDSEQSYWQGLNQPGRRLLQYGYLGLVVGYAAYYDFYAGSWDYYFSGAWSHDGNGFEAWFKPGFYQGLPMPKLLAVPLTLGGLTLMGYGLGLKLEGLYRRWRQRSTPELSGEVLRHQMFSMAAFLAFNAFFLYAGRPEVMRWGLPAQLVFQSLITGVSWLWLAQVWDCSPARYDQERLADARRQQLQKLDAAAVLGGRSLDQLSPAEVEIIAQVLPLAAERERVQLYRQLCTTVLRALRGGRVDNRQLLNLSTLKRLEQLRLLFGIAERQHQQILADLQGIDAHLALPLANAEAPSRFVRTLLRPAQQAQLRIAAPPADQSTQESIDQSVESSALKPTELRRPVAHRS